MSRPRSRSGNRSGSRNTLDYRCQLTPVEAVAIALHFLSHCLHSCPEVALVYQCYRALFPQLDLRLMNLNTLLEWPVRKHRLSDDRKHSVILASGSLPKLAHWLATDPGLGDDTSYEAHRKIRRPFLHAVASQFDVFTFKERAQKGGSPPIKAGSMGIDDRRLESMPVECHGMACLVVAALLDYLKVLCKFIREAHDG